MLLAPAGTLAASQTSMPYVAVRGFAKKKRSRNAPDLSDFEDDSQGESAEVPQSEPEPVQAEPEPVK